MNAAPTVEAQLRHLEEQLLQADVRASAERLDALLADDFIEFGSSGRVFDKKRIVKLLPEETPINLSLNSFKSRMLSETIALVTYRATSGSKPAVYTLRSSIWRLSNGQWQIVFHQGTPTK
jgi:hypothetical protein